MAAEILLVCGSLRRGSVNAAVLTTAADVAPAGVTTVTWEGLDGLPHFNPDDDYDPLHPAVVELRAAIASADAEIVEAACARIPVARPDVEDGLIADQEIRARIAAAVGELAHM